MLEWNDNFTNKRWIGDTSIIVGEQNFDDNSIMIKEENGNVISCPMYIDNTGDIFFIYNDNGVSISDYMGCFDIHELLKG